MSGNWSLGWLVGTKHFPESKTRQLCGNTHYCANARFTLTMRRKQKSMKTHVWIWTVQIVIASIARISWKTMPEKILSQVNEEIKYVIPLTDRRLRFDSVAEDFFQMCAEGWKTSSPKNACVGGYNWPRFFFFLLFFLEPDPRIVSRKVLWR